MAKKTKNPQTKGADAPPSTDNALTPQLRSNAIEVSTFTTVDDFTAAYNLHDAAIRKAIPAVAEKQAAANLLAEQDVIPHLSYMQSLLSKKGSNHDIVIAARKAMGNHYAYPWWTEYYDQFKDKLWQSLDTIQRRIKEYREDPTDNTCKRNGCKKVAVDGSVSQGAHRREDTPSQFGRTQDPDRECAQY